VTRAERLAADGAVNPVLFYRPRDEHGWASNYSGHGIVLPHPFTGVRTSYGTGEHRFQAMKATTLTDHERVRRQHTASAVKSAGGPGGITLRPAWGDDYGQLCWYVMLEVTLAKARQHADVREALLATGTRHIYEDSPRDSIWGWRRRDEHNGKNLLGRCWMHLADQ
jgi:ribA/ribD-fused uncharacterized protein